MAERPRRRAAFAEHHEYDSNFGRVRVHVQFGPIAGVAVVGLVWDHGTDGVDQHYWRGVELFAGL